MDNITYRKAHLEDLKILFDLAVEFSNYNVEQSQDYKEFFGEDGNWETYFKEEIEESLKGKDSIIFLALDNQKPIGYILAAYYQKNYFYIIEELYVNNNYRGQRIGKSLLEKAIEWGKKFDCPIRVEVYNWNQSAKDFYLKNNFIDTTTILELK